MEGTCNCSVETWTFLKYKYIVFRSLGTLSIIGWTAITNLGRLSWSVKYASL
jgi:hypothetical protein